MYVRAWAHVSRGDAFNHPKASRTDKRAGSKTVQNVCIVAAIEMGLLQLLAANQGKSLTASDLAEASGYDELFIGE